LPPESKETTDERKVYSIPVKNIVGINTELKEAMSEDSSIIEVTKHRAAFTLFVFNYLLNKYHTSYGESGYVGCIDCKNNDNNTLLIHEINGHYWQLSVPISNGSIDLAESATLENVDHLYEDDSRPKA